MTKEILLQFEHHLHPPIRVRVLLHVHAFHVKCVMELARGRHLDDKAAITEERKRLGLGLELGLGLGLGT